MSTRDAIAEPWGGRTPYGSGDDWPTRVDTFLDERVDEGAVDRWVQSAAVLHSNGDGLDIAVKDGRIVGVRGRAHDRVNRGRLDPKDLFGWQANASADRLTTPLIRKNGELVPTDWDTAMDRTVEHTRQLLDAQHAVGFDELAKRVAEFPPQRAAEICPWPPTTSAKQPEFSALRKAAVNGVAGIKDDELLNLTKRCHPQSLRQMRWANAMLEELSPQTLAS